MQGAEIRRGMLGFYIITISWELYKLILYLEGEQGL